MWLRFKRCPIRNSTNPSTGSRLLMLQDVTCTGNSLPVENTENVHHNNNTNNNTDNNNNDNDNDNDNNKSNTANNKHNKR